MTPREMAMMQQMQALTGTAGSRSEIEAGQLAGMYRYNPVTAQEYGIDAHPVTGAPPRGTMPGMSGIINRAVGQIPADRQAALRSNYAEGQSNMATLQAIFEDNQYNPQDTADTLLLNHQRDPHGPWMDMLKNDFPKISAQIEGRAMGDYRPTPRQQATQMQDTALPSQRSVPMTGGGGSVAPRGDSGSSPSTSFRPMQDRPGPRRQVMDLVEREVE